MTIKQTWLSAASLLYLYAAIIVFLLGWVKLWIAIPACVLMGYGIWLFIKERGGQTHEAAFPIDSEIKITRPFLAVLVIGTFIMCLLCGYGGFFTQAGDWQKHNAVLSDLTLREWPVYYYNQSGTSMLTYYIGQYLVPAAIGKIFSSFRVAEIALLFNNWLGIILALLLLFQVTKAKNTGKQLAVAAIFYAFGAVILLSHAILSLGYSSDAENLYYYWLSDALVSYRSAINSLRWVFQLCIPSWIATALFLDIFRNPRYYVVIAAPLLLHTVFAFLSAGVMMLLTFIYQLIVRPEERKLYIKRAFASLPNLLVLLGGVVIPFIYLSGNIFSAEKPESIGFSLIRYTNVTAITYFAFVSGFLCYSLLIWRKYEKSFLFYLVNGILLIAPFLRLGQYNDLGMNTTIPVLYVLMIFVIRALFVDLSKATQNVRSAVGLICLLALSGIYCIYDLSDVVAVPVKWDGPNHALQVEESLESYAYNSENVTADVAYNYYTHDPENKIFGAYFAAQQPRATSYQLGEEILFTQEQDGRRYFQGGISGIEGDFSWSDGYSSGLKLDIGEAEKDITAFFEFEMIYNGSQTLIVTCHGETLFNELVTQPQVSFTIPRELIEDGIIELEFDYPDAVSPLEINGSADGRILAFAWSKIVFD